MTTNRQKAHVLVVEDNAELRRLVVEMLDSGGYTAQGISGAEEALRWTAVEVAKWDLLITDMIMPGATGQSVAKHFREHKPDLDVLFISGYPLREIGEELPGGFLQKPFSRLRLLESVGALLSTEKKSN